VAAKICGGAYNGALAMLSKQVTQGLVDSSRGTSTTLDTALEARPMFTLLRHRTVAETSTLSKIPVSNLDAFSFPEKTWPQFVAALDQNLTRVMAQYAKAPNYGSATRQTWQNLWRWDTTYSYVVAAQFETPKARHAGETDMNFLMRNLAQAADPTPPETVWFAWAIGFHAAEAATCLAAGYESTAGWHLSEARYVFSERGLANPFTASVYDPRK